MQTISVAVTTYNGETYLERQLQSLLSQSLAPDGVIVCNDGSTDRTWEILQRLKETAPPAYIFSGTKTVSDFGVIFSRPPHYASAIS